MVMSSTCMMIAIITKTVTIRRRSRGAGRRRALGGHWSGSWATALEPEQPRQPAAAAGVDLDGGAHARAQPAQVLARLELDPQRHALHDLDPVAGGVLRREDGELRAGAGADGRDRAAPLPRGNASTVMATGWPART